MTQPAIRQLRATLDRALADPDINTSQSRAHRARKAVSLLDRIADDLPPHALRSLTALFSDDVLGHPSEPDTILGRAAAGAYRTRSAPGKPLTAATQRDLMDGLADLNRAAGHPPFPWEQHGARPWSKHTRTPLNPRGHIVLRRALSRPGHPRSEPYRLRLLAALEILWATGVTREGLVAANTTDLADDGSRIRLTINPPGRTEPTVQEFALSTKARNAVALWLPVRREVVAAHLDAGPDHPANRALFITLRHAVGTYPDGSERMVPPGLRITGNGLEVNYSSWARRLNQQYTGHPDWPVPTDLYQIARGRTSSP